MAERRLHGDRKGMGQPVQGEGLEQPITDQELIDGDLDGTLTQEQKVEYLIRIEKFLPRTARMIIYTDWDKLAEERRNPMA